MASPYNRNIRTNSILDCHAYQYYMRINTVKRTLQSGRPSFGTWLSLGDLLATRSAGPDGLGLADRGHGAPADRLVAGGDAVRAIADAGCVRSAACQRERTSLLSAALDAGAFGVVVPMVNTVEQAQVAIAAAKYPPLGNRSVGGSLHSLNFATNSIKYYAKANDEILVILQTESPEGVANAEAIYSLPGVDAIFVGPNDLQAQMRQVDGTEATTDEFEAMLARIIEIGKKTGTPTGMHCMDAQKALCACRSKGCSLLRLGVI